MTHIPPIVQSPSRNKLETIAREHHLSLDEDELAVLEEVIEEQLELYERLDELSDSEGRQNVPKRTPGYRPPQDENPYNAVVSYCEVQGSESGPLAGYTVGVKDSIAIAGVEMTCGSKLLEGFAPGRDATAVSRLLSAGANVTAKTNMEDLAWSGSGELSAHGPVRNPRDPNYLAGGSSGGSAAAVAGGVVDIALGTDQGGSVRMPASWCGIVGLKPTHGLVPYTGTVPLDPTIDHLGPLTADVTDCARVLDVIAGEDGLDPRQGHVESDNYVDSIENPVAPADITIGVLAEGFGRDESEAAVDDAVRDALGQIEDAGASVEEVSVPWHEDGGAVLAGIAIEGTAALARDNGVCHFTDGKHSPALATAFGRARRTNADDYPPMMTLAVLLGQYLADQYQSRYYAKAQNLVRDLRAAYDDALADVDVLALPTTPHSPYKVTAEASLREVIDRSLSMNGNTSPFNGTGHPAISVPCGRADDLPVGLMLVGDRFDDATVLEVAKVVEDELALEF